MTQAYLSHDTRDPGHGVDLPNEEAAGEGLPAWLGQAQEGEKEEKRNENQG